MHYPPSELVLNDSNRVYHLDLAPENIADKIILVGDQDRVQLVADFFDSIEHKSQHREFTCQTGIYKGKRLTVLSTGIGTDNIDITINELDALVNIDLESRSLKNTKKKLELIRIGTCGLLQSDCDLHSYVLSNYALGLDNVAHFYSIEFDDVEMRLSDAITKHINLPSSIQPYLVASSPELSKRLDGPQVHKGITVTSSGFYGPQGRTLRLNTRQTQLNEHLMSFQSEGDRIMNFEMESSALFALGKALGHDCTTICLGVANRARMEFSKGYKKEMKELIEYVLDRF